MTLCDVEDHLRQQLQQVREERLSAMQTEPDHPIQNDPEYWDHLDNIERVYEELIDQLENIKRYISLTVN